jgi:hypothetical protein
LKTNQLNIGNMDIIDIAGIHIIYIYKNVHPKIYSSKCVLSDLLFVINRIGSVMVSVLASTVVDIGFEIRSGQTKDYNINICYFSDKQAH